ncbi:MAG: MoaD/ThiS family protein [Gammaproteobacteria bacterium]|nr:MoaD/ThiS family protein [Gammaproteobacteria bacterium]
MSEASGIRVTVRLFAGLRQMHLLDASGDVYRLHLANGSTPVDLCASLGVDPYQVHIVILNGEMIHEYARAVTQLEDGDYVDLWPEVAGG